MVLRMKNFNILRVHRKIQLLGVLGGVTKNHYRGGDCLKRDTLTVCQFKGEPGKKEGVLL